jgi:signal transduction histidine kinase/DNA-binding response OmpR family regulator/sugar lactone lactonase YvrE
MKSYIFLFLLVSFLLGLFPKIGLAQDYLCKVEKLSIEDGLSNPYTYAIGQDDKGFMWFGSKYGLNRYDGYQFKIFTKEEHGLQSNIINKICVDPDSNLWIGHTARNENIEAGYSGIDILDINTFEIIPLEQKMKSNLGFKVVNLSGIHLDQNSRKIYLPTKSGELFVYHGQNKFSLCYTHPQKKILKSLWIGEEYYWLFFLHEIIVLDKNFKLIAQQELNLDLITHFQFVGEENPQTIYVLTKEHLLRWTIDHPISIVDSAELQSYPLFDRYLDLFGRGKDGNGYMLQEEYDYIFSGTSKQFLFRNKQSPTKVNVLKPYIDNQKNIWIGNKEGVTKITCKKNYFNHHFTNKEIGIRSITTLYQDSLLFFSTYKGFVTCDLKNKSISFAKTLAFSCFNILKTQDEDLWLAGKYTWLSPSPPSVKRVKHLDFNQSINFHTKASDVNDNQQKKFSEERIWATLQDKRERLWIGSSIGLSYIRAQDDSISFYTNYGKYPELKSATVNDLYENKEGLWVASSKGLYLIDQQDKIIKRYAQELAAPFHLPHNYILHIHETKDGFLWLSTKGGGIIKLDKTSGNYEQFTTKQGLSHNIVYAILEDDYGYFWMSSNYGLMRFNPKIYTVNTYLKRDGLLHNEFNQLAAYQAENGLLYFGGIGVISLNPADFLNTDEQNIPLEITGYRYFDNQTSTLVEQTQKLVSEQKINLNYTDRFFVIDFSLLDFDAERKIHYAYKIEGLDKEWNYTTNNSIRINGLQAGNYTLHIKGQGNRGIWSNQQLKIPITVKQPFYLTWQFLGLVALILIGLGVAYVRQRVVRLRNAKSQLEYEVKKRTQKIEQQANELKELDNVKSRFFANISHELRTPLTLILGPLGAILEQHYGDNLEERNRVLKMVQRNGFKLQSLVEEILVLSKLEAQTIELEEKELEFLPFIRRLFLAFEAQAELQEIDFIFDYKSTEKLYVLLDDNKFEKILNNLLSNALKYTPRGGRIELNIHPKAIKGNRLQLQLLVKDSGKGIYPEDLPYIFDRFYQSKHKEAIVQGGTGIGLALSYEFAELLEGSLTATSTLGEGSTFKLNLPIKIIAEPSENLQKEIQNVVEQLAPVLLENKTVQEQNKTVQEQQTILIVEDNDDMRLFVAELLGKFYRVLTAENGRLALNILENKHQSINLIVSDVMMPELDGFQLLQQVKTHPAWQQLPMIMLTARAAEEDKLFALQIGVDDYLQKPFSRQELLIRIQNLLKNHAQRKVWQKEESNLPDNNEGEEEKREGGEEDFSNVWIKKIQEITLREMENSQFGITSLAYDLHISVRQLRRKIKLQTGLNPNQYIKCIKLEQARKYLEARKFETVAQVSKKVGFSNPHYFSTIYMEQYGKRPIDYLKNRN